MQEKTRGRLILEQLRGILISGAVGPRDRLPRHVFRTGALQSGGVAAYGALIGAFGYVFCAGLAWLLRGWLAKHAPCRSGSRTRASTSWAASSAGFSPTASRPALGLVHFRVSLRGTARVLPGRGRGRRHGGPRLLRVQPAAEPPRAVRSSASRRPSSPRRRSSSRARCSSASCRPQEISGEGYRISSRNLPARFVAGDFYDVFNLADGSVGLDRRGRRRARAWARGSSWRRRRRRCRFSRPRIRSTKSFARRTRG